MRIPLRTSLTVAVLCIGASAFPQSYQATVVDVTAGDIYQVESANKKQMVVLYGVVAPASPAAARQAHDFGTQKVLGQKVTVRVVEKRKGMTLVELTMPDKTNLGQVMLRNGLVQWDSLTAAGDQGLKDLEALAKQDRVGIWATTQAGPAPAVAPGIPKEQNERQFQRRQNTDYDILEGRAYTDEKGVPTLVLRGNGQKSVGFENAAEQQRIDRNIAEAEEAEWAAMEEALAQEEADRLAAEEQQRIADAEREAQMQNLQMLNQQLLFGNSSRYGGGIRLTPLPMR